MTQPEQASILLGWLLSIIALVATAWYVVHLSRTRKQTESPVSTWVAYTIGIFVTIFILLYSQELAGLAGSEGSPRFIDSLFSSLQMFGMNRDIELDMDALQINIFFTFYT